MHGCDMLKHTKGVWCMMYLKIFKSHCIPKYYIFTQKDTTLLQECALKYENLNLQNYVFYQSLLLTTTVLDNIA